MSVSPETVRALARELLGRTLPEAVVTDMAQRLGAITDRLRALDEGLVRPLEPVATFHPGQAAWQQAPAVDAGVWAGLGEARPGDSGYSGLVNAAPAADVVPAEPPAAPAAGVGADADAPAAGDRDLLFAPLTEVVARIRRRELSPVAVTRAVLARIEALQPTLNAYYTVTAASALAKARAVEGALARGEDPGPLAGVPVALKDLFETAGVRTTAGSAVLRDHVPAQDGVVVSRLRAAGAVLVGKTATHEFAFGATTDNPHYGPTRNPWHPECVPGGSSGGSGAAVAAGAAYMAMGTDTGGSIRIPAAACGVVGLKPTYGRVPKAGVIPLSWSLDHVGPLARTVADAALVLGVIAGPDPGDAHTVPVPVADWAGAAAAGARAAQASRGLTGCRIGVDPQWLSQRVHPEVQAAMQAALRILEGLGAAVETVALPPADQMLLVNRVLALAEAGAYHAPYLQAGAERYGADVRARMELGQFLLARDYLLAQRLRGELCRRVHAAMGAVDVLVVPGLPLPAPRIGAPAYPWPEGPEAVPDALVRLTAGFNVTGQPVVMVPCGFSAAGLPLALQVVGRPFDEATVLKVAAAYEAAAGWHRRRPAL